MRKLKKKRLAGLLACFSLFQSAKTDAVPGKKLGVVNTKSSMGRNLFSKTSKRILPPVLLITAGAYSAFRLLSQEVVYKIKLRCAGSGDLLWRKAFKSNDKNKYVVSNENRGSAFFEFGRQVLKHKKEDLNDAKTIEKLCGTAGKFFILVCNSLGKRQLYTVSSHMSTGAGPTQSFVCAEVNYKVEIKNLDTGEEEETRTFTTSKEAKDFIIQKSKSDDILEYISLTEYNEFNAVLDNNKINRISWLDLAGMIQKYGKLLYLENSVKSEENGEERKFYVWKKETVKVKKVKYGDWKKRKIFQIEYTMPGPQDQGGICDTGEFSIKRNICNGPCLLISEINKHIDKGNKIYVSIKGHSRGGVAANIISNRVAEKFGDKIEMSQVAFDPVPGNSLVSNNPNEKEYRNIDLRNTKNSAVIYALKSDYETLGLVTGKAYVDFQPQQILNAKVTIISEIDSKDVGGKGHGVGTQQVEIDANGKAHKHYFYFNGKAYSQGNLWQLPAGLYWVGNDFQLKKMDSDKEFARDKLGYIKAAGRKKVDEKRRDFLCQLISKYTRK